MRIKPKDIARSLLDSVETSPNVSMDDACESALRLLRRSCPGVRPRDFAKLVERELKKRGETSSALLVVPNDKSLKSEAILPLLEKKTGKAIHLERNVEPDLIGGAVLLVEHRRIDCSIQGALAALLKICLQPLD